MITRLSRNIFQMVECDRNGRRAVEFAIFMKDNCPTSVVKDWSYKKLARISHLAPGTCKKYLQRLHGMKLVRFCSYKGQKYLIFKKLKEHKKKNRYNDGYHTPKNKDIQLGKYNSSSFKEIVRHVESQSICEIQRRKGYAQQSISAKQNPHNLKEYKKAMKVCRARGWDSFSDNGISYKTLCRALHCSPNTVSSTIRYGEMIGLFTVTRSKPIRVSYDSDEVRRVAGYWEETNLWSTEKAVYYQPANKYSLPVSISD